MFLQVISSIHSWSVRTSTDLSIFGSTSSPGPKRLEELSVARNKVGRSFMDGHSSTNRPRQAKLSFKIWSVRMLFSPWMIHSSLLFSLFCYLTFISATEVHKTQYLYIHNFKSKNYKLVNILYNELKNYCIWCDGVVLRCKVSSSRTRKRRYSTPLSWGRSPNHRSKSAARASWNLFFYCFGHFI